MTDRSPGCYHQEGLSTGHFREVSAPLAAGPWLKPETASRRHKCYRLVPPDTLLQTAHMNPSAWITHWGCSDGVFNSACPQTWTQIRNLTIHHGGMTATHSSGRKLPRVGSFFVIDAIDRAATTASTTRGAPFEAMLKRQAAMQ